MKKRAWLLFALIVLIGAFAGCTVNIFSISETPTGPSVPETQIYQKSVDIIISHISGNMSVTSSDLEANSEYFPAYIAFIKSDEIKEKVLQQFPGAEFTVDAEHNSSFEIVRITVKSELKGNLADICNAVARYACEGLEQTNEGISCSILNLAR